MNAMTFKIIQLDARKGVLGQLAIPTGKAPRLNFSLLECFSKVLAYWWKVFAKSNFLNHNVTCCNLVNLRLKSGSIGFFRVDTSQVWAKTTYYKDLVKVSTTAALDKDENLLWSGLRWHLSLHSNEMTPLPILLAPVFLGSGNCFSKIVYGNFSLQ